jgi:hypothetical protein
MVAKVMIEYIAWCHLDTEEDYVLEVAEDIMDSILKEQMLRILGVRMDK